jgi:hypothetical protein
MKREEIKDKLRGCTSLVELVGKANELKRAGEKESTVNRVVTELRREMLSAGSSIKRIPREEVPTIDETPIGRIVFSINQLGSPTILYDGETILI